MNHTEIHELLERKFGDATMESVRLDGRFSGYASVFGALDLGNDIVEPGAFAASLRRRGAEGIRMLFQHDPDTPIGVWEEVTETPHGLRVRGRITPGTGRGSEVLALMRDGAIDGLSIGFRATRAVKDASGARRILEADLWEISIVTFPMQESARIETVKATQRQERPTVREFERWLVRDAGLTRSEARWLVARGYSQLPGRRDATGATGLAGRIRAAASRLHP